MEPVGCPIRQECLDDVTAVNRGPVPNDDHPAGHLTQEVLQEGDDVVGVERVALAEAVEFALGGQGTDGRQMLTGPPLPQDGRLAHGRIGADDAGQGINPGLVYEENTLPLGFRPLLMAGQVSSRQRVMAASSRWRARRAGFCGLQRIVWHTRPTWRGW